VTEAGTGHWDLQARARELEASGRHVGGPPDSWALDGRLQLIALLRRGLNPDSDVVDVGCGALRAGYWLIHFLEPGRYQGIDPMKDNVDAARAAILEPGLEAASGRLSRTTTTSTSGCSASHHRSCWREASGATRRRARSRRCSTRSQPGRRRTRCSCPPICHRRTPMTAARPGARPSIAFWVEGRLDMERGIRSGPTTSGRTGPAGALGQIRPTSSLRTHSHGSQMSAGNAVSRRRSRTRTSSAVRSGWRSGARRAGGCSAQFVRRWRTEGDIGSGCDESLRGQAASRVSTLSDGHHRASAPFSSTGKLLWHEIHFG